MNGKSIMGLMMLAAGQGSKLLVTCEGADAEKALAEIEAHHRRRSSMRIDRRRDPRHALRS